MNAWICLVVLALVFCALMGLTIYLYWPRPWSPVERAMSHKFEALRATHQLGADYFQARQSLHDEMAQAEHERRSRRQAHDQSPIIDGDIVE